MSNWPARSLRVFDPAAAMDGDFSFCTLREVFERWYLPAVLTDPLERSRPAADSTLALYRDALGWWEKLTRNPVASEVCDADAVAFLEGLKTATFRRSKFGADRVLSPSTRAKHVSTIRAILSKLTDAGSGRASLDVLAKRVRLRKPIVNCLPRSTPPIDLFLSILARLRADLALSRVSLPAPSGSRPVLWWRAMLATQYAHGWRLNTALSLKKSFIVAEDITRLRVPAEAVGKTHKPAIRPVPAWLSHLWSEANVAGPEILGCPVNPRWLLDGWHRIQRACGVGACYSLHSIRRLHAMEVGRAGYDLAAGVSRDALQHSDSSTTRAHYADLLELAILRLRAVA